MLPIKSFNNLSEINNNILVFISKNTDLNHISIHKSLDIILKSKSFMDNLFIRIYRLAHSF